MENVMLLFFTSGCTIRDYSNNLPNRHNNCPYLHPLLWLLKYHLYQHNHKPQHQLLARFNKFNQQLLLQLLLPHSRFRQECRYPLSIPNHSNKFQ